MKHTQGEWKIFDMPVDIDKSNRTIIVLSKWDDEVICDMRFDNTPQERIEANAKLIVVAPKMLEALKYLTDSINLSKLNIKKDFSLINAHANATKIMHKATE